MANSTTSVTDAGPAAESYNSLVVCVCVRERERECNMTATSMTVARISVWIKSNSNVAQQNIHFLNHDNFAPKSLFSNTLNH